MEKEDFFWCERKEKEDCFPLFQEFLLPHLGAHQTLKEFKEFPTRCEFIIKNKPIQLNAEKKNWFKEKE